MKELNQISGCKLGLFIRVTCKKELKWQMPVLNSGLVSDSEVGSIDLCFYKIHDIAAK